MIRVHIICEGQTEEMFVNDVLSKIFIPLNIFLYPSLIGKPGHKGGNFKIERVICDVKLRLLNDINSYCTTLFDFYGLPNHFPGKREAILQKNIQQKQEILHHILVQELTKSIGTDPMKRFFPYVQMYEFEALLFSSPQTMAIEMGQKNLIEEFKKIRNSFESPEHINNSELTAPSKRIKNLYHEYEKVMHGSLITLELGIEKICEECNLFNQWINKIKNLNQLT
ncbi:DUF4276 family protein [Silvanigrella aquatica]|uniref:DUF4276 domain-containing protein n=1 Tax=Silvanigrella aquatica TaxID=1915309 RepID=A0A1L4CZX0_9BACT|nr:DUF4276 family protein [Silvanigrella aquatica]APJ03477.1 hypothetical protein AXG55_05980 [Silvanigrella aquatica]